MTSPAARDWASIPPGQQDPIGWALAGLAAETGGSCLLESIHGQVVGHLLAENVPSVVERAVLRRDASLLHAQATSRRTIAVHGPALVRVELAGVASLVLPLTHGLERVGWCWLVGVEATPDLLRSEAIAAELAAVVVGLKALGEPAGTTTLRSRPVDVDAEVSVIVLQAGRQPAHLASVLRRVLAEQPPRGLASVDVEETLTGLHLTVAGRVSDLLDTARVWAERASQLSHVPLVAAVAGPGKHRDRERLAAQAFRAVAVLSDSTTVQCLHVSDVRSELVLSHIAASISSLPDLGPDPLDELIAYDERRGTQLSSSLIAWLDANNDMAVAASRLHVHPNTLRYRIRRATEVLGADWDDPVVRLDYHLRLRNRVI